MEDRTNVPNPHQGTLRYGKINTEALKKRIEEDFVKEAKEGKTNQNWQLSLTITHRNETNSIFQAAESWEKEKFFRGFSHIYVSDGEDRDSVHVWQESR